MNKIFSKLYIFCKPLRAPIAVLCLLLPAGAVWSENALPTLGKVWLEKQVSNPEGGLQTGRSLTPMPDTHFKYADGKYQSVFSRITMAIPVIGNELQVSVRESVVSARANNVPITSHVIFIPGATGAAPATAEGVSAVVVTLLRDDRPKDSQSVLTQFEPPNDGVRALYARQGAEYSRVKTNFGEAVQRVLRNRSAVDPFPYQSVAQGGADLISLGVTRHVVAPNDSLIEFSQVVPCTKQTESECKQKASISMDRFMSGVSEFLLISDVLKSMPSTDKR
jgi:hypothetical protein